MQGDPNSPPGPGVGLKMTIGGHRILSFNSLSGGWSDIDASGNLWSARGTYDFSTGKWSGNIEFEIPTSSNFAIKYSLEGTSLAGMYDLSNFSVKAQMSSAAYLGAYSSAAQNQLNYNQIAFVLNQGSTGIDPGYFGNPNQLIVNPPSVEINQSLWKGGN